jgi:hypothetical protein
MGGAEEENIGRPEIKCPRQRDVDLAGRVQLSRMCQRDAEGNIKSVLLLDCAYDVLHWKRESGIGLRMVTVS